jgi:glycosyltransferase 2 family protein
MFLIFQYNLIMRKFLIAVALLAGVLYIIFKMAEVQAIVETLKQGDWRFVILAFLLVGAWTVNIAVSFRTIYRSIGLSETVSNLLPMVAAAQFVNVIAPAGGMSGIVVFMSEARRRNYSPGKATIGAALYVLFDYAAFFCVLAVGLFVLFRRNTLNVGELLATGVLLGVAIFVAFIVYLGFHSSEQLGNVLSGLAHLVNRFLQPFLHHNYLSEDRAKEFAQEAADGLRVLRHDPKRVFLPLFLALTKLGLLISIMLVSFLAFKVKVSPGTLIAGFSLGYLFMIVSPTPSGLGIVEGVLTLAFTSMYIPLGTAAVVALAYRGFTFWLPLLFGMGAFRSLGSSNVPK